MNHWDLYLRARMACVQDALAEGKSVAEIAILFGLDTVQARTLCNTAERMAPPSVPKRELRVVSSSGTVVMSFNNHAEYLTWYERQTANGHPPMECWKRPEIVYTFTCKD